MSAENNAARSSDIALVAGIPVTSIDGQHLTCLLYALRATGGGSRSEVTGYIRTQGLLLLTQEDRIPYPSQTEPAWMTDIAWARKIGVLAGIISDEARNAWELNRAGATELDSLHREAGEGKIPLAECFLWTEIMKRVFNPKHLPKDTDIPRPPRRRRRDSPYYYLSAMQEMFARGLGGHVASKLSERLGRAIASTPVACALAHKEWEDRRFQELLDEFAGP